MSILFCGGEDIDFPNGGSIGVNTSGIDFYRTSYARCGIYSSAPTGNGFTSKSSTFQGGAVTSAWLTCVVGNINIFGPTNLGLVGVGLSGTTKGLYIGIGSNTGPSIALLKYDGTTWTVLQDSTTSWAALGYTRASLGGIRFDMHVINYGASATVNLYSDIGSGPSLLLTYTGNVAVSGMANFDSVFLFNPNNGVAYAVSEIIVSDVDTRSLPGLVTLALNGAGGTNAWTSGTYSNINGTTASDANPAYTNTTAQDEQFTVSGLPSGTWTIAAVKTTLRAAAGSGATATKVNPGWYSGSGSPAFGGTALTAATTYGTLEHYDTTNPVTATAWAQADFTGLQMDLRSA